MAEFVSRVQRVRAILDAAHKGITPGYGGLGSFWNRPVDELETLSLFGVALIAAADSDGEPSGTTKSCCATEHDAPRESEPPPAAVPLPSGRGAASGLVRGLRGQFPFDSTQFVPLPWGGGARVSDSDINFIESWIDDGLPTHDAELPVPAGDSSATPEDDSLWQVLVEPVNVYKDRNQELRQRINVEYMSPHELEKFRRAHAEMLRLNRFPNDERSYFFMARWHQNHCQHAWERFLPWHRVYLYEFEQLLRDFEPSVTIPYWDWPMPMYKHGATGVIPTPYRAFLTKDSIKRLRQLWAGTRRTAEAKDSKLFGMEQRQANKLKPLVGKHYDNQTDFFADVASCLDKPANYFTDVTNTLNLTTAQLEQKERWRRALIKQLLEANPLWYPLRYPGQYGSAANLAEFVGYHYPGADDVRQIMSLNNFRDFGGGSRYNDAYGFLDQNPHNTLHIYCGGVNPFYSADAPQPNFARQRSDYYTQPEVGDMLSNLTASFDPIFWPHHVNVDRLWARWQQSNPHANPQDLDAAMTPWNYRVRDTLDHNRFGYEYVSYAQVFPLDNGQPVQRFHSGQAQVPTSALTRETSRVELRLHRVPQLLSSCFIRVFLNLPGANASTRMQDNPHYAGFAAVFGHGSCYGGPGHCAIPPTRPSHDARDRDHSAPRNYRVDVTECVRRLVAEGATDLSVTLVVVGPRGEQRRDLLRVDAVSINFID